MGGSETPPPTPDRPRNRVPRGVILGVVFAVPAIIALGLFAWASWPTSGQEVLLQTRPVDPPDPLRGDYVELSYLISRVDGAHGFVPGDAIYVLLSPTTEVEPVTDDPYWGIHSWYASKPSPQEATVCVKGTVRSADDSGEGHATVEYGIEQYFIQKDEDLREWNEASEVGVVVNVRGCAARVTAIHLDGVAWQG